MWVQSEALEDNRGRVPPIPYTFLGINYYEWPSPRKNVVDHVILLQSSFSRLLARAFSGDYAYGNET